MGYELIPRREEEEDIKFSLAMWPKVLKLALAYDWIPRGTELEYNSINEPIPPGGWNGSYFGNDLQFVTKEDAINLADALERAIENIPDLNTTVETALQPKKLEMVDGENLFINQLSEEMRIIAEESKLEIPTREELSKLMYGFGNRDTQDHIRKFIFFCRSCNGFTIF